MNPTLALVIMLTLVAVRPFFEIPDAIAKAEAQRRGGYKPKAATGCMYLLLIPVLLGLWWWYALATNQILLAVIPTVGAVVTVVVHAVERQATR